MFSKKEAKYEGCLSNESLEKQITAPDTQASEPNAFHLDPSLV